MASAAAPTVAAMPAYLRATSSRQWRASLPHRGNYVLIGRSPTFNRAEDIARKGLIMSLKCVVLASVVALGFSACADPEQGMVGGGAFVGPARLTPDGALHFASADDFFLGSTPSTIALPPSST